MSFQTVKIHGFFVFIMNSFNGFSIESINVCPGVDYASGLKATLYYAPDSFFTKITLPSGDLDFQNHLLISIFDIEFQQNCGWSSIDILIDENELKSIINGQINRKKTKSQLDIFILGYTPKVLGFIEKMKNKNLIFLVVISDGTSILFGNLLNRANFNNSESSSGKKYEDNSGSAISLSANSPIYFISENLILTPVESTPLDFSNTSGGFFDITNDY